MSRKRHKRDTDRSDLSAYLDGELAPAKAEAVAKALAGDSELRADLEALQATRDAVAALPKEDAPEGLHDAVLERLARQHLLTTPATAPTVGGMGWARRLATAAVLILAVSLGIILHSALSGRSWVERVGGTRDGEELARRVEDDRALDRLATAQPTDRTAGPMEPARSERVADAAGPDVAAPELTVAGPELDLPELALRPPATAVKDGTPREIESAPQTTDEPELLAAWTPVGDPLALPGREQPARPFERETAPGAAQVPPREPVMSLTYVGQTHVAARSVRLETDDREGTNRQVSAILVRNRIRPQTPDMVAQLGGRFGEALSRSNSFYNIERGPDVNEIVFYVTESDAPRIIAELQAVDDRRSVPAARSLRRATPDGQIPTAEDHLGRPQPGTEAAMAVDGPRTSVGDMGDPGMGMRMGMTGARDAGRGYGVPDPTRAPPSVPSLQDGDDMPVRSAAADTRTRRRPRAAHEKVAENDVSVPATDPTQPEAPPHVDLRVAPGRRPVGADLGRLVQVVVTIQEVAAEPPAAPSTETIRSLEPAQTDPDGAPARE